MYTTRMTTQLAIRVTDEQLRALDELAAAAGISRSEAARRAIDRAAIDTPSVRLRNELDRVGTLLGVPTGAQWATAVEVVQPADPGLAEDLIDALGDDLLQPL